MITRSRAPDSTASGSPQSPALLWLGGFVLFAVLYLVTCQDGPGWLDSGMLQYRVWISNFAGARGTVVAHPLYIAVGHAAHLMPGAFCWNLNALSGLAMAAALANLMCLVSELTGRRWVGLLTAGLLAICHAVWWLSTIAEVYTLTMVGLTAELWLLHRLLRQPRPIHVVALGLVSGLGLANHNFALLPLPVYGVVATGLAWQGRLSLRSLAAAAVAWIIGASPVLFLTIRLAIRTGSVEGALSSALFGIWENQVLNVGGASRYFKTNLALISLNFISVIGPLAIVGWIAMRRRLGTAEAAAFAAITVIHILFVARYSVPDQFTFALPALAMIAIAAGLGIDELARRSPRWRRAVVAACCATFILQPTAYAAAPRVLRALGISVQRERQLAFRDEARWFLVPWKHNEDSARRFAAAAFRQADPDGVILRDSAAAAALRVFQVTEGISPGVYVEHLGRLEGQPLWRQDFEAFRRDYADRPVFLVSAVKGCTPLPLLERATFHREPDEVLYRVVWPDDQAAVARGSGNSAPARDERADAVDAQQRVPRSSAEHESLGQRHLDENGEIAQSRIRR